MGLVLRCLLLVMYRQPFSIFHLFLGVTDWTQGLTLARQVLRHWANSQLAHSNFLKILSHPDNSLMMQFLQSQLSKGHSRCRHHPRTDISLICCDFLKANLVSFQGYLKIRVMNFIYLLSWEFCGNSALWCSYRFNGTFRPCASIASVATAICVARPSTVISDLRTSMSKYSSYQGSRRGEGRGQNI